MPVYTHHISFIFPVLVQSFGPFVPSSNLVVFESPFPPVLSLGPLVPWSPGPLVLWSLGLGSLVLWSLGLVVLKTF